MNKELRKAVFVLAGALGLSGIVMSQDAAPQTGTAPAASAPQRHEIKGGDAEGRLERMSRELNLTEDQKTKLKPIFQSQWQEMKPVQEDTALSQAQKHEKLKGIHEKYRAQIEGVLTPEQQDKWKKMQSDHMQHGNMNKNEEAPKD